MLMQKPIRALTLLAFLSGCNDAVSPSSPDATTSEARGTAGRPVANVKMMDACDPVTFAGVPGGCQRSGGVTFDHFVSQLQQLGNVPSWRFTPADLFLREGDEYNATNVGGEVHTFTEVEEFGGGIVPVLNQLMGLTSVVPECEGLPQSEFIPPGQSTPADDAEVGDEHYQCCIHPWMRMTVHVR